MMFGTLGLIGMFWLVFKGIPSWTDFMESEERRARMQGPIDMKTGRHIASRLTVEFDDDEDF